ncbi:hypothetical protein D3C72_1052860 [compost metagenome]
MQRADAAQAVHLDGAVGYQIQQSGHFHGDLRLARFIRRQESFIARQQIAAHARFQVDRQLHDFIRVADHPFGMLDRAQGRQQVGDQGDEHESRDDPNDQRQGHVAGEDAAKAEGVDRGLGIHHVRVRLSRKSQF